MRRGSIQIVGLWAIALIFCGLGQAEPKKDQAFSREAYATLESAPPGAAEVKLSEGQCRFLSYRIEASYPNNNVIQEIEAQLQRENWTQLTFPIVGAADISVPAKWKQWTNVMGRRVHTKEEQWRSPAGNVVYYKFWYFAPDLKTLHVDGRHCSAEQLEHTAHYVDCKNAPPVTGDDPSYSAVGSITRIEPLKDGYRVHFHIKNKGSKTFLLPLDGKRNDGSPHLRVYPEQQENGEWSGVDNECLEYSPQVWIDVNPGESVESWVDAVDFPVPNKRFGMCTRKIGHLHGPIRISFRFFTSICDIQDIFAAKKPYFADSEPVETPLAERK